MIKRLLGIPLFFLTMTVVHAQDTELEMLRSYFSMERKVAIAEFMDLTGPEEITFWNIYDQYEIERKALSDERIKLIQDYAENFDSITDEKAEEWMNIALSRLGKELKLRKKYLKKMSKEISPVIALKYAQIDGYINSIVEFQLNESLPFIGEDINR